ncbi:MAG: hypothetical protein ACRDE7_06275 [Sphingobacterium sp.]
MRYVLSYIYHFFISNSRHGTHSPFVYALAEQVIYNRQYKLKRHVEFLVGVRLTYKPLLEKILDYLLISTVSKEANNNLGEACWSCSPVEMKVEEVLMAIEAGKLVIVDQPYKKSNRKFWKTIIKDPRVIVSINLFHFGLLMYRQGQQKEDFLLRYL